MWTESRVEILKDSWRDGLSASKIAELLGEVTRNAVIGKVHRLGLAGRSAGSRPGQRRAPRAPRDTLFLQTKHTAPKRAVVAPIPDAAPPALKLALRELTNRTCHWPIGDPMEPDFGFCGRQKALGVPYCSHHTAIAYNPAPVRRRAA